MNAYEWWVFEFGCRTDVPLALLREKIRLLNLLVCELILMRLHFHGVWSQMFYVSLNLLEFFLDGCVIGGKL